jgi:hypothetical protein
MSWLRVSLDSFHRGPRNLSYLLDFTPCDEVADEPVTPLQRLSIFHFEESVLDGSGRVAP